MKKQRPGKKVHFKPKNNTMTWNDLINALHEWQRVYPDRMEEEAVFYSEMDEICYVIDETEIVDMESAPVNWDSNVGDEGMQTTLALFSLAQ